MKKLSAFFVTLLLIIFIPLTALSANYIGNKNFYKFHFAGCHHVNKMKTSNKVPFSTRQESINASFVPCKVCRP